MTKSIKSSRKVGRPTLHEQLEIQNLIKPYYEIGLSAEYTATQKRISIKTVQKYFRIWTEQLRENFEPNISERQKNAMAREIQSIDSIIYNLRAQLNRITKAIIDHQEAWKANNSSRQDGTAVCYRPDPYLEDKFTKLNELLLKTYDGKASIEAAPTIDEETEKAVFQRMSEKSSEIQEDER